VNHRQVRRENWEDRKYPISEVGWNGYLPVTVKIRNCCEAEMNKIRKI